MQLQSSLIYIFQQESLDAYQRILKLEKNKDDVYLVGCPRIDLVKSMLGKTVKLNKTLREGVGQ